MRRCFAGAWCHGKFDDDGIDRNGNSDDGSVCRDGRSVCRDGKLGAGTVQHHAL
jgi:hypothetical protein